MLTISFEVKDKHDLLDQVYAFLDTTVQKSQPAENKEQITSDPAPVPTPAASEQQPTTASQDAASEKTQSPAATTEEAQGPAPILTDEGLDNEGVPWDVRIHSASKSKVKDGTWKKKRGVSQEEFERVKQELKKIVPESLKPTAPSTPPVPSTPTANPTPFDNEPAPASSSTPATLSLIQNEAAKEMMAPSPPVAEGNVPTHNLETFKEHFIPVMAKLKNDGVLTPEYINTLLQHFGVEQLWQISQDDQKLSDLFDNFANFGWVKKV